MQKEDACGLAFHNFPLWTRKRGTLLNCNSQPRWKFYTPFSYIANTICLLIIFIAVPECYSESFQKSSMLPCSLVYPALFIWHAHSSIQTRIAHGWNISKLLNFLWTHFIEQSHSKGNLWIHDNFLRFVLGCMHINFAITCMRGAVTSSRNPIIQPFRGRKHKDRVEKERI